MPLKTGKKNIGANIKELMSTKPSASRKKAIATYAKKHGVSSETAKYKMAQAIAMSQSRKKK